MDIPKPNVLKKQDDKKKREEKKQKRENFWRARHLYHHPFKDALKDYRVPEHKKANRGKKR